MKFTIIWGILAELISSLMLNENQRREGSRMKDKCQIITILYLWMLRLVYGAYSPQGIKLVKQIGKKIQEAPGENCLLFSIPKYINGYTKRQCSLRYGLPKR